MVDALIVEMPVELSIKLAAVVRLDRLYAKRQPREHIIDKVNGVLLVVAVVDLEHAQPGAIINGRELKVVLGPALLAVSTNALQELHVDLDTMTW